jgi:hypothetical protein
MATATATQTGRKRTISTEDAAISTSLLKYARYIGLYESFMFCSLEILHQGFNLGNGGFLGDKDHVMRIHDDMLIKIDAYNKLLILVIVNE